MPASSSKQPLILTIPGLGNSGPGHWQTRWEELLPGCHRIDLGLWDDPHRNTWVNKINLAIQRANRPVVLVAHSLGCHALAWWAHYEQPDSAAEGGKVIGALLVAPPDVEEHPLDRRLTRFAPVPDAPLPFRAVLAASRNDPYMPFHAARKLAQTWGAGFADAGAIGHINAQSDIGDWAFGRLLLNRLLPQPLTLGEGPARIAPLQRSAADAALRRIGG
jgi:uncharacterized protein